jgi:glycosyltransferase involved in cell wall biosynthesis
MRIVLLNYYYAPDEAATAQLLADVGAGLVAAGHDVSAVCSDRAYADPRERYPKRETIDGVKVRRVRSSGFGRSSAFGRLLDYLSFYAGAGFTLLFRADPDVVLALTTPPMVAALGVLASRLRGGRSVFWVMDVYPDLAFELGVLRPHSIPSRLLSALSGWILQRSDRVVALDDAMADRLRALGATRVAVIHNWADDASMELGAADENVLRKEWGWSDRFVVLYSGNLGLAHEFETVLDAAEALQDRPDVLFAFVGGGPRRAAAEAEVARRGLSNVEFRPYVPRERLGLSLPAGDVHLVTLRPNMPGLLVPSKIYGILAAARPTIYVGPAAGGVYDIVSAGSCGTVLVNGDAAGLAGAVRSYADDPDRRRAQGSAARKLFEERYAKRHGVAAFTSLLGTLGSSEPSP